MRSGQRHAQSSTQSLFPRQGSRSCLLSDHNFRGRCLLKHETDRNKPTHPLDIFTNPAVYFFIFFLADGWGLKSPASNLLNAISWRYSQQNFCHRFVNYNKKMIISTHFRLIHLIEGSVQQITKFSTLRWHICFFGRFFAFLVTV